MTMGALAAIQFTGDNDAAIAAWLPTGVTCSRLVDLLIVDQALEGHRGYGFPGEVRRGEWIVQQSDYRLRRVSDSAFKQTWRQRVYRHGIEALGRPAQDPPAPPSGRPVTSKNW